MHIGIIGSGNMGAALGTIWAKQGHQVLFSYSRTPAKLNELVSTVPNASSGSVTEAAQFGEVILLAVPYPSLTEVLQDPSLFAGKTLITCVSGLRPDFRGETVGLPTDRTRSVAEEIAQLLPQTQVVEAFNLTFAEILQAPSRQIRGQSPSLFYCSDHNPAKQFAVRLIEECGYEAIDAGPLKNARSLETLASVWVQFAVVSGYFPRLGFKALLNG